MRHHPDSWEDFRYLLNANLEQIRRIMLPRRTPTNEPARCARCATLLGAARLRWRPRHRTFLGSSGALEISCKCGTRGRGKSGSPCRGTLWFALAALVAITSVTSLLGSSEPKPTFLGITISVHLHSAGEVRAPGDLDHRDGLVDFNYDPKRVGHFVR